MKREWTNVRSDCRSARERNPERNGNSMAAMNRRKAREQVLFLLFETEFHPDETPEQVMELAREARDMEENDYVKTVYLGVREHREEIDGIITRHSHGWKTGRITPLSLSAMRLGIYEMLYVEDVPPVVAINEAIELVKTYDDEKMRAFVNGVLNGVKDEIAAK